MTTSYDVPPNELIGRTAEDLKDKIKLERPEWTIFVKTGAHKERQPEDEDWWWIRAAAVLRKVYMDGPVGVTKLRREYGGRKNRGHKPEKFYPGSGKIIRTLFQEFDELEFTQKVKGGRMITKKGQSYLDKIATDMVRKKK